MASNFFFAFGTTAAGMTNAETVLTDSLRQFHVFNAGRIPLLPPVVSRALDSSIQRNGKINSSLAITALTTPERIALNTYLFGSQSLASKRLYVSTLDEFEFYTPYYVSVQRPYEGQEYRLAQSGGFVRDVILPLWDCQIQTLSKTSDYTITTADHYIKTDNSGGDVTLTFGDLSGFTADVVYSFEVVTAGNDMIIKASAGDGGGTITTLSAAGARVDIAKVGGAWSVRKSGSMV